MTKLPMAILATATLLAVPAASVVQAQETREAPVLPGLAELDEGWNTLEPGGETTCAHGTEYEFYARAGDPERVLVYLYGGGACWNAELCQEGSENYTSEITPAHDASQRGGILDPDHPENPFSDYTMVGIPVCTGDVHLGDRDVVYTLEDEDGERTEFTIHHRGLTNTLSAIDWVKSNVESPEQVFVASTSAGAVGLPFHASLLAQHYPEASVVGLGNDASSYGPDAWVEVAADRWGVPEVLRAAPGWESFGSGGVPELFVTGGTAAENLSLYQLDHARDLAQHFWLMTSGDPEPDVLRRIGENQAEIRSHLPGFRSFILGGTHHGALTSPVPFYRSHVDGHSVRGWVAAIADGESVPDVRCDDCDRGQFTYDDDDLAIVTATIELLTDSGWSPDDQGGPCPEGSGALTLRCAVVAAIDQVSGAPPLTHPAALEIVNEAVARTSEAARGSFLRYNNDPERTVEDVVEMLEEVRERIWRQLGEEDLASDRTDRPTVIRSLDELPPRSYVIDRAPSELLDDREAFAGLAVALERDLLDDLDRYRFEDRSLTRRYYQTLAHLAMLDGRYELALDRIERARAYEGNPTTRHTLGLVQIAAISAWQAEEGEAEQVFRVHLDELISKIPLEVAEPDLRVLRRSAALLSEGLLRGTVQARIDPGARDLTLSDRLAYDLVGARANLDLVRYGESVTEVIDRHLATLAGEEVDIWAERGVELADEEVRSSVLVAIWDSGLDTDLFRGRLFVDPESPADRPVHGLAFDSEVRETPEMLRPIGELPEEMSGCPFKGLYDLQAGLDTPEARSVQQLMASVDPARVNLILEGLGQCQAHIHGTHVAGIAAESNPGVRLLGLRGSMDLRIPPAPLDEERIERHHQAWSRSVEYLERHSVRVANMSWGITPMNVERNMELNGIGGSVEERRALAREAFDQLAELLESLLASAANVLFVAAAGNADSDNRFIEMIPGSLELPNLLTVGAVDRAGRQAPFTSYGRVDLYANGVDVESVLPGGDRMPGSGTSMAAPQVANLAAKLLALDPDLDIDTLRRLILDGTDEHTVGEGRTIRLLNPARSLELLRERRNPSGAERDR